MREFADTWTAATLVVAGGLLLGILLTIGSGIALIVLAFLRRQPLVAVAGALAILATLAAPFAVWGEAQHFTATCSARKRCSR